MIELIEYVGLMPKNMCLILGKIEVGSTIRNLGSAKTFRTIPVFFQKSMKSMASCTNTFVLTV